MGQPAAMYVEFSSTWFWDNVTFELELDKPFLIKKRELKSLIKACSDIWPQSMQRLFLMFRKKRFGALNW
uniref:Uncharacterized protein n=1 Tax=Arundo donax TaxID=35708 RepID=A0A0A9AAP4_ARUDO